MKKNFTQLIFSKISRKQYLVVFASLLMVLAGAVYLKAAVGVTVSGTSAFAPLTISADAAANSQYPVGGSYTAIGNIVLTEGVKDDFPVGSGTLLITAPSGWRFNTGASAAVSLAPGETGNASISGSPVTYANSNATIQVPITVSNTNKLERITITGVQVQPLNGSMIPAAGSIQLSVSGLSVAGLPKTLNSLSQAIGAARKLAFTSPPVSTEINTAQNNIRVTIQDQFGSTVTGLGGRSITLGFGSNPGSGTLTSTPAITDANSVATFTGVSIDRAGTGYVLTASGGGYNAAISPAFNILNKKPLVSSVAPCLSATNTATTVIVSGQNYVNGTKAYVGDASSESNARTTALNADGTLSVSLTAADLSAAGSKSLFIKNPAPATNNGISDAYTLTINPLLNASSISGSGTACEGGQAIYSVPAGFAEYSWTVSAGGTLDETTATTRQTTVSFDGSTSSVTLTVTAKNNCDVVSTSTKVVSITQAPVVNNITSSLATQCIGANNTTSFTVTGSFSDGISAAFSSSNANFSIQNQTYNAANGTATATVVATGSGSADITMAVTGGAGCAPATSQPVTLTVLPLPTLKITNPAPLCNTTTADITASSVTSGSTAGLEYSYWLNADGTGVVSTPTAVGVGTYYIKGTNTTTGCFDIKPVTITAVPEVAVLSNKPLTICAGQSVTLSTDAVNLSGMNWYRIENGSSTAVRIGSASYDATTEGDYYAMALINGCWKQSNTVRVTVNPLPKATASIVGEATKCLGANNTITFSVSGTFADGTPQWVSSNTAFAIQNATYNASTGVATANIVATGAGTSNITLTTASTTGCGSATSSVVTLRTNPLPSSAITLASGTTTFCEGGSVTLRAPAAPAGQTYEYQWYVNNTAITAGGTARDYIASTSGNYTVKVTNTSTGCSSTSATATPVTVNPLPAKPTITNLAAGYSTGDPAFTMQSAPSNASGRYTVKNASGQTVSTSATLSPCSLGAGTFTVTYTYSDGTCSNTSDPVTVTIKNSTYTVIVRADPFPNCRGDIVKYEAFVYRDVTKVTYPYLVNSLGEPVDASGNLLGNKALPIPNPAYPFPDGASTPQLLKDNSYRYFQPIVEGGERVDSTLFDYQWTKNQEVFPGSDRAIFKNAGLSSLDYYAVQVTPKAGAPCGATFNKQLSNRNYSAALVNYEVALNVTGNPICPGGSVTLSANLNSAFSFWNDISLVLNWMLDRNGTISQLGSTQYSSALGNTVNFTTAGPAGGFVTGDKVYVEFNSMVDDKLTSSKCAKGFTTSLVEIIVNTVPAIASQPTAQTVCAGNTVSFTAGATGTGVIYQWYKRASGAPTSNGTPVANGGRVSGATTSTLTIAGAQASDAGLYYVVASGTCPPTAASVNAELIVKPTPALFALSGTGTYCTLSSPDGIEVGLNDSEIGVNYQLKLGSGNVGAPKAGTGEALSFGMQPSGTYTVEATFADGLSCPTTMSGQALVSAKSPTTTYGELSVTWNTAGTQWIAEALQYASHGTGATYEWFTRMKPAQQWLPNTSSTTNTLIIPTPHHDLEIMARVTRMDGLCEIYELNNINVTPLPVELIYLKAEKRGKDVRVEWATASEDDNKGFEVQVSTDGKIFRTLSFVPSKDSDSRIKQLYEYMDTENGKYGTRYYRLKQIDKDGSFEYFGAKAVSFDVVANKIKVYPNPFESEVELSIDAEEAGEVLITVANAIGKQLLQRTIRVEKGVNVEKMILDPSLPRGMYIVTTRMGDLTTNFKLLKK